MATKKWPFKDPNERLDYTIDWAPRLVGGETISSVSWTISGPDSALTEYVSLTSNTTTTATIGLQAGTEGNTYTILCRVTTSAGRILDQSVTLKIKSK